MQALTQSLPWKAARTDATDSDKELLRLIANGNEQAFTTIYDRYQGPLYRFAFHMSCNTAIAEEITQEVFMLLIRGPKNFDADKGSLGGYLFGIARNLTRRVMERNRTSVPFIEEFDEEGESALTVDATDQQDIF